MWFKSQGVNNPDEHVTSTTTHFGNDERVAVLEPAFQRDPPRGATVQLNLDVVERHELLDCFHSDLFRR